MPNVQFYCILCGAPLQASAESRHDLAKCPCCSRYVPVPRRANLTGDVTSFQAVFPPEVLELSVKFACSGCGTAIRADARCEGRQVTCDDCGAKTPIPRWSNVASWTHLGETGKSAQPHPGGESNTFQRPTLTVEEIDYLRGTEASKPEAAA